MLPLLRCLPAVASEEDFRFVVGILSETDNLPRARVRELWEPAALAEKDQEIKRCEELWGDKFREACERILVRLQELDDVERGEPQDLTSNP